MNEADLVIVIGARAVCQWDCSGTAWKQAGAVINLNSYPVHAGHYNRSVAIVGDAGANLRKWVRQIKAAGRRPAQGTSEWYRTMTAKKQDWERYKRRRYESPTLPDQAWDAAVLTQPAAIKTACDFARSVNAVKFFDAGDVQASGFQIVEDQAEGETFSDTGASYIGFAASALLACAIAREPRYGMAFCGDGSFTMNPRS